MPCSTTCHIFSLDRSASCKCRTREVFQGTISLFRFPPGTNFGQSFLAGDLCAVDHLSDFHGEQRPRCSSKYFSARRASGIYHAEIGSHLMPDLQRPSFVGSRYSPKQTPASQAPHSPPQAVSRPSFLRQPSRQLPLHNPSS